MGDIQKYTEKVTIIPTDYISYNNRGIVYSKLSKNINAINDFTKATQIPVI